MPAGPVTALRDVSLRVDPGDYVAITGPSGCGKSTLLHLIGCVDSPSSGAIVFEDRDVAALSESERSRIRLTRIGFVFQRFFLLPMLTAAENIELPQAEAGVPRRNGAVGHARCSSTSISPIARDHLPSQLSGGEMQRVAIARALANRPALLVADEPTGELDEATGDHVADLFDRVHADGTAILVVTHNPVARGPRVAPACHEERTPADMIVRVVLRSLATRPLEDGGARGRLWSGRRRDGRAAWRRRSDSRAGAFAGPARRWRCRRRRRVRIGRQRALRVVERDRHSDRCGSACRRVSIAACDAVSDQTGHDRARQPSAEESRALKRPSATRKWPESLNGPMRSGDAAWSSPKQADLLRAMDRFHPVPRRRRALSVRFGRTARDRGFSRTSWAEWLYFNGRSR